MPEFKQAFLRAYTADPDWVGQPREDDRDMGVPGISQQCTDRIIMTWADLPSVGQVVYGTDWLTLERRMFINEQWRRLGGGSSSQAAGGILAPVQPPELPAATLPAGLVMIAPGDYPDGCVLVGPVEGQTLLMRKPNSPGVLLRPSIIGRITVDDNADQQTEQAGSAVELTSGGLLVYVSVLRWMTIAVDVGGEGARLFGPILRGLARGGYVPDGMPCPSAFGLHVSQGAKGTYISAADVEGSGFNGLIDNGQGTLLEDSKFGGNHLCWSPQGGGGQVDFSGYARGGTARRVIVAGSSGEQCSGFEVDGQGQTLDACEAYGQKRSGMIVQAGQGHAINGGSSHNNGTGLSRQGDAQVAVSGGFRAYDNAQDYDGMN